MRHDIPTSYSLHFRKSAFIAAGIIVLGTLGAAQAASDAVRTSPVGFATLRIPGKSARAISVPLNSPAVFSGTIESVAGGNVTVTGASWAGDAWGPFTSKPFVARLVGGASAGLTFPILSNSAETLSLDGVEPSQIKVGQQIEIVPVDTLAGLFGENGEGLLTGSDPTKVDNVMIHDGLEWNTYYNDGTGWLKSGAGEESQNTVALLPDQGIFIVRRATSPLVISVNGEVAPSPASSELPADAAVFLANPFPLNTRLNDLKLQADPSWLKGSDADSADRVLIYSGKEWIAYFHDGKSWRQKGGTAKNPLIAKGTAIVIERKAGTDIVLTPQAPYSLN